MPPYISKYSIGTGLALAVHQMIAVLSASNEIAPTSTHCMLMESVSVQSLWSMVHECGLAAVLLQVRHTGWGPVLCHCHSCAAGHTTTDWQWEF